MNSLLNNTLAAISDYVQWWQWVLLVILIALIIFYWQYKKKQV